MARSNNPVWSFLSGRSRRAEYWPSWIALIVLNAVMTAITHNPTLTSFISLPFWIVIASRRLHDFGGSAWWSLVPFGCGFAIGVSGSAGYAPPPSTALVINAVVTLGTALVIGIIPGSKGANRFGPPPGAHPGSDTDRVSDVFR